ncbi:MAG: V-type ATPase subunit [Firmicutes bacterium]|nr:V-type ATPase subunit [Bacillota bacterium]
MGNASRFAAINAKVRALKGRMLTEDDFVNLLKEKKVKGIARYLKENTSYKKVLKNVDINDIHRGHLEYLLKKYIVLQYEKLIHYFTDEYRKLFRVLFIRYEVEDLKLFIRAILRNEDIDYIKDLVVYSGIYSTVNYDLLIKSKGLEEFIENLKGTIYYDALKPYINESEKKISFYMEMSLDRIYFRMLYEQANKLSKHDRKILIDLLGKNIDLLNLEWIYRGLKYYDIAPEELINYTLMGGLNLNYRDIKDLCYSESDKELIKLMLDSRYGFLFDNEKTMDLFMERRIERYLYFNFKEYFRKGSLDIIQSIAFMHLLEFEMRDIISITEGIRYGLNEEKMKSYLIRRIKGSD